MLSMLLALALGAAAQASAPSPTPTPGVSQFFCNVAEIQGKTEHIRVWWFDGSEQKLSVDSELLQGVNVSFDVGPGTTWNKEGKELGLMIVRTTITDGITGVSTLSEQSLVRAAGESVPVILSIGNFHRANGEKVEISCAGPSPN